jgi:hypothetical protein
MGGGAYRFAGMLGSLACEHRIKPHMTVFDKSARKDGTFSRNEFSYDRGYDIRQRPAALHCTPSNAVKTG